MRNRETGPRRRSRLRREVIGRETKYKEELGSEGNACGGSGEIGRELERRENEREGRVGVTGVGEATGMRQTEMWGILSRVISLCGRMEIWSRGFVRPGKEEIGAVGREVR